jgi:hypothetical protein
MDQPTIIAVSPIRRHARNDLRQLAMGLLWLEKKELQTADRVATVLALEDLRS